MSLKRIKYRIWQVINELFPKYDKNQWQKLMSEVPDNLKPVLEQHKPVEKAHIIRVYNQISSLESIYKEKLRLYKLLAIVHDIGKTQYRLSLPMKVIKVLFGYDPAKHCERGKNLLIRMNCSKELADLVYHHHDKEIADELLSRFCEIDNIS